MDICAITAFDRPEFLMLCLERAFAAAAVPPVWVFLDRGGAKEETRAVCAHYPVTLFVSPAHPYHGNSFNALEALRAAHAAGAERVFLVEDDVMVGADFFDWHRRALEQNPAAFCSIASPRRAGAAAADGEAHAGEYCSVGVCLPRASVEKILPHATPAYYRNMVGYCERTFPASGLLRWQAEQDGLIHRILRTEGSFSVWAAPPRAWHAGFYGYHRRNGRPVGTLAERIEQVRVQLANPPVAPDVDSVN